MNMTRGKKETKWPRELGQARSSDDYGPRRGCEGREWSRQQRIRWGRFDLNSSKLPSANGRGAGSNILALARGTRIHTYTYTETHKHVQTYLAVICFPESWTNPGWVHLRVLAARQHSLTVSRLCRRAVMGKGGVARAEEAGNVKVMPAAWPGT
jgi:hypothetical protein